MTLVEDGRRAHPHPGLRHRRGGRRHRCRRHRAGRAHRRARRRCDAAEAARLANYGGGVVVMKLGTATVTRDELTAAIERDFGRRHGVTAPADKLRSPRRARCRSAPTGARGASRVVLANGAFDLLHVGHVRYLAGARRPRRPPGGRGQLRPLGARRQGARPADRARGRAGRDPVPPVDGRPDLSCSTSRPSTGCSSAFDPTSTPRAPTTPSTPSPSGTVVEAYGGETVICGDPKDHATTDLIGVDRATIRRIVDDTLQSLISGLRKSRSQKSIADMLAW